MKITLLPLVYGVLAFHSMVLILNMIVGQACIEDGATSCTEHAWNIAVSNTFLRSKTILAVADLYEAYALYQFSKAVLLIIKRRFDNEAREFQEIFQSGMAELGQDASALPRGPSGRRLELSLHSNSGADLLNSIQKLSLIGVMVFVFTYFVKSSFVLTVSSLSTIFHAESSICDAPKNRALITFCNIGGYIDGAALFASTLAITNLIVVEQHMKAVLHVFGAVPKFFAVKLLLSMSYIQEFLVGFFFQMCSYSNAQQALAFGSLTCLEVLPVAFFVFYAWGPKPGDWHDEGSVDKKLDGGLLLAGDQPALSDASWFCFGTR